MQQDRTILTTHVYGIIRLIWKAQATPRARHSVDGARTLVFQTAFQKGIRGSVSEEVFL